MDRERTSQLLKGNYKYYDLNRDSINKGHMGEYVLIQDCAVKGYYKDDYPVAMALFAAGAEPGSFILHQCLKDEDDYIDLGFHRPIFAREVNRL